MAVVFERILSRTMMTISFGEDISDTPVELDVRVAPGSSEFVRKSLPIAEAAREYDDAVFDYAPFKWQCKWYQALRAVTGVKDFTRHQRILAANGQRLREALRNYIK